MQLRHGELVVRDRVREVARVREAFELEHLSVMFTAAHLDQLVDIVTRADFVLVLIARTAILGVLEEARVVGPMRVEALQAGEAERGVPLVRVAVTLAAIFLLTRQHLSKSLSRSIADCFYECFSNL